MQTAHSDTYVQVLQEAPLNNQDERYMSTHHSTQPLTAQELADFERFINDPEAQTQVNYMVGNGSPSDTVQPTLYTSILANQRDTTSNRSNRNTPSERITTSTSRYISIAPAPARDGASQLVNPAIDLTGPISRHAETDDEEKFFNFSEGSIPPSPARDDASQVEDEAIDLKGPIPRQNETDGEEKFFNFTEGSKGVFEDFHTTSMQIVTGPIYMGYRASKSSRSSNVQAPDPIEDDENSIVCTLTIAGGDTTEQTFTVDPDVMERFLKPYKKLVHEGIGDTYEMWRKKRLAKPGDNNLSYRGNTMEDIAERSLWRAGEQASWLMADQKCSIMKSDTASLTLGELRVGVPVETLQRGSHEFIGPWLGYEVAEYSIRRKLDTTESEDDDPSNVENSQTESGSTAANPIPRVDLNLDLPEKQPSRIQPSRKAKETVKTYSRFFLDSFK
ncbi:hypothetical protein I302_107116 [Kwoniella bestiolae CBS 10118]|uniref:Uncharacterized protein n=1 Tax=Kwoniella bestiolae CBS 10118 TaxID=1296100 RepID=A0A1B9FZH1_9TREE|nr:hypothetical protein I302_05618 [Kwoniella bestiolae CBS 10118]OCF24159.1 hypothetical protein I302_05618 [Kwoniella bestiolae CBS 10118]